MKCPRCHRDTYSAKWNQCTACDDERRLGVTKPVTEPPRRVTKLAPAVTKLDDGPTVPIEGRPRVYQSAAERQRAYRARSRPA